MARASTDAERVELVASEASAFEDLQLLPSAAVVLLQPMTETAAQEVQMYIGPMVRLDGRSVAPSVHGAGSSEGDGGRSISGPMRARKTKRMERRLTHWRCVYCRHETRNDAEASACRKCGGERAELRDADATGREEAWPVGRNGWAHRWGCAGECRLAMRQTDGLPGARAEEGALPWISAETLLSAPARGLDMLQKDPLVRMGTP